MADLITLARAQELPALAAVNAAYLAHLISAASNAIERWCKRVFGTTIYTNEYYDGNGTDAMFLNNFPITTLTSIVVVEPDGTDTTLLGSGFDVSSETGEIKFERDCSTDYCYFPLGFHNLKANYTAGFATVPEDVQEACAQYCVWLYAADKTLPNVKSESLGDYAMSFATGGTENDIPGSVKRLLTQYRNLRP